MNSTKDSSSLREKRVIQTYPLGTNFITELSDMTGLPLDNYFLSPTKLKKVLNYRF